MVSYTASNFFGQHGESTPAQERLADRVEAGMAVLKTSTSGLGGVWAEENTREAIFSAMQRRETFGTSGVRIKVRLFGGWEFTRSPEGEGLGEGRIRPGRADGR